MMKYIFCRVLGFYHEVLDVKVRPHFYVSFVVTLLLFANIFVLINTLSLLFLGYKALKSDSSAYIYVGCFLGFSIAGISHINGNYLKVVNEIQALPSDRRKRLSKISILYVALTLLALLVFVLLTQDV